MVATEKIRRRFFGCQGLGPWRFTFAANCVALQQTAMNVRLHRASRGHLTRVHCWSFLAANVNLLRASRGHPSAVHTVSTALGPVVSAHFLNNWAAHPSPSA